MTKRGRGRTHLFTPDGRLNMSINISNTTAGVLNDEGLEYEINSYYMLLLIIISLSFDWRTRATCCPLFPHVFTAVTLDMDG